MILNNMTNLLRNSMLVAGMLRDSTSKDYINPVYPIINTSGEKQTGFVTFQSSSPERLNKLQMLTVSNAYLSLTNSYNNTGYNILVLGTGKTPVSAEDYVLESIITSGITLKTGSYNRSITTDSENGKITRNVTLMFSVQNTGSNDISVSEAGLLQSYYSASATSTPILIHREVFDAVTIPAGGVRQFQFDFEIVTQIA